MSRLHVESHEKTLALAEWVQGVIEGQVPATRKTPAARRAPRQRCLARRSGSRTQDGRCGARATGRTGRRGAQGGNRYVVTLGLILTAAGRKCSRSRPVGWGVWQAVDGVDRALMDRCL